MRGGVGVGLRRPVRSGADHESLDVDAGPCFSPVIDRRGSTVDESGTGADQHVEPHRGPGDAEAGTTESGTDATAERAGAAAATAARRGASAARGAGSQLPSLLRPVRADHQ